MVRQPCSSATIVSGAAYFRLSVNGAVTPADTRMHGVVHSPLPLCSPTLFSRYFHTLSASGAKAKLLPTERLGRKRSLSTQAAAFTQHTCESLRRLLEASLVDSTHRRGAAERAVGRTRHSG
jgi:hypothetical protein